MALDQFKDLIEDFAKDSDKENNGVWMPYGRHEFLVARAHRNNAKFFKMLEKELRPFQWAIDRGNFGAIRDAANDAMQRIYANTILLGIRKQADKVALDYSPEDGAALFKKLPDFWDKVFDYAGKEGNYAPDNVEADSKN